MFVLFGNWPGVSSNSGYFFNRDEVFLLQDWWPRQLICGMRRMPSLRASAASSCAPTCVTQPGELNSGCDLNSTACASLPTIKCTPRQTGFFFFQAFDVLACEIFKSALLPVSQPDAKA